MGDCSVKKECDRLLSQKAASGNPTSNSQSPSSGHLRNVNEEGIEEHDVGTNEVNYMLPDTDSNDTNKADLV
jgi:hypothetical protein